MHVCELSSTSSWWLSNKQLLCRQCRTGVRRLLLWNLKYTETLIKGIALCKICTLWGAYKKSLLVIHTRVVASPQKMVGSAILSVLFFGTWCGKCLVFYQHQSQPDQVQLPTAAGALNCLSKSHVSNSRDANHTPRNNILEITMYWGQCATWGQHH